MLKRRIKLVGIFQLITVTALVLLTMVIIGSHIFSFTKEYEKRSIAMRSEYLEQQKALIKREVERAVELINEQRSHAEYEAKKIVKQRTYDAIAIAENLYQKNKELLSPEDVKRIILDALSGVRFARGTGYYFITDFGGRELLFPDKPETKGTSLLGVKDPEGHPVVRDMIELVQKNKEGFYQYHWTKPEVDGNDHKKIAYVKEFKPFKWIIGTGLYVEDIETHIKEDVLRILSSVRFGSSGYLFVNDLDGNALVANGHIVKGSPKLWDFFNSDPEKIKKLYAQEYEASLKPGGDFIYYSMNKLDDATQEYPKISFIYGLPDLHWLIGAGVYLDEIEKNIAALERSMKRQQSQQIYETVSAAAVCVVIVLLLFYWLSQRLKNDMELFVDFFDKAVNEEKVIDSQKIYFDGLFHVAENVNSILIDKKETLKQLQLSEEKYRNIFNTAQVGMFRTRISDGLFLEVNKKAAKMLNFEAEEIIGKLKTIDLFKDPLQRKELLACLEKDGFVDNFEINFIHPTGREIFYVASVRAYPEEGYMEGVVIDITDQHQAKELLQASEERFRTMAELLPEAIFETNVELDLTYANQRALELLGYTEADLEQGLNSVDMFSPEEVPKLLENVELQFQGEKTDRTEYLCRRKDGSVFPALFRVSPIIKDGKPVGIRGVLIDLTERKRAAELLKESEERFRTLAEMLPEAVFETDSQMQLTYGNQRAFELYGYSRDDFTNGLSSLQMFAPEEHEKVLQNISARYRGEKNHSTEYLSVKKDGTVFPALFHVSPIIKDGQPAGLRGIVVDLTDLKQSEEEVLKLRKLESVGVLAGGIAHDFNNLLAGLFGNIEMAKRSLSDKHKSYKYLESAGASMERAIGLTQQLLTFAKGGDPVKEIQSIDGVIEESATFSLHGSNLYLELKIAPDLWLVNADKGQLSQVITNLVINAKEAMPDGGVIQISAENIESDGDRQVKIRVHDQGAGIDPEHLNKIFDPYFSTKPQGSGLGLASCHSIISKHNGTISVDSEPGKGTTFTILLPALENPKTVAGNVPVSENVSTCRSARILLLDDDESVLQMSLAMLEEMGHVGEISTCGEDAISMYRKAWKENQGYDLVICDLTIPGGMGGEDAAQEILKTNPQARVVVSSGYATDPIMANYTEYGFSGCVAKPYLFEELKSEIERVLAL